MNKAIILTLLLIVTLQQTTNIPPTEPTTPNPPPEDENIEDPDPTVFTEDEPNLTQKDIPIDNLDEPYISIKQQIQAAITNLTSWQLVNIQETHDQNTNETYYYYTYSQSVEDGDEGEVQTEVVTVIDGGDGQYVIIFDDEVVGDDNFADDSTDPMAGGFAAVDASDLTEEQRKAKQFILDNIPALKTWELASVESQVVEGSNICFTFYDANSEQIEEHCVWSRPWLNGLMQLSLPQGNQVFIGGPPPADQNTNDDNL